MEYHAVKFSTREISPYRESLGVHLDPGKRKRIESLQFQVDRDRTLIGTILSRTVLCQSLGLRNCELKIDISPHGKPYIKGCRGVDFNISHSASWIVCGLGKGRIGVDVEMLDVIDEKFAERHFSPYEVEIFRNTNEDAKQRLFYSIWALKESYIKALGMGLSEPLDGFSICFQEAKIRAISNGSDAGFHFRLFQEVDPDFCFAMCSENLPPKSPCRWVLEDLVGDFLRICQ